MKAQRIEAYWGGYKVAALVARNPYYGGGIWNENYSPDEEPFIIENMKAWDEEEEEVWEEDTGAHIWGELQTALIDMFCEMQQEPDPEFHYA